MVDPGHRERENSIQPRKCIPRDMTLAASPGEPVLPRLHCVPHHRHEVFVVGPHPVILVMATQLQAEHAVLLTEPVVPVIPAPLPDGLHCATKPFLRRLPLDNPEPSTSLGPEVGESEEVEGAVLPVFFSGGGWPLKPRQHRFRRVYGKLEEIETCGKRCHHPSCLVLPFEADEKVIGPPNEEASALQPGFDVTHIPPVEDPVEEDITENR